MRHSSWWYMNKQEQILEIATARLIEEGHPLSLSITGATPDEILSDLFHGYRKSTGSGWQLTDMGFMVFSAVFKPFHVKVETTTPVNPRILVLLDNQAKFPYFLVIRNSILDSIETFDHDLGFILSMYGGDTIRALS